MNLIIHSELRNFVNYRVSSKVSSDTDYSQYVICNGIIIIKYFFQYDEQNIKCFFLNFFLELFNQFKMYICFFSHPCNWMAEKNICYQNVTYVCIAAFSPIPWVCYLSKRMKYCDTFLLLVMYELSISIIGLLPMGPLIGFF